MNWIAMVFVAVLSQHQLSGSIYVTNDSSNLCIGNACGERQQDTAAVIGEFSSADACVSAVRKFLKDNPRVATAGRCQGEVK